MKFNNKLCENIDIALFLYVHENDIFLSKINALDFRNWCYKKARKELTEVEG